MALEYMSAEEYRLLLRGDVGGGGEEGGGGGERGLGEAILFICWYSLTGIVAA